MYIWIDAEWNGDGGELISLGLVAADGEEFYEVLECTTPVPWVAEHVIPSLGKKSVSLEQMRNWLSIFLHRYNTVHLIADWPEDIARFCMLLIVGNGIRINTPRLTFEINRDLNSSRSEIPHNALSDARAIMAMDNRGQEFVESRGDHENA